MNPEIFAEWLRRQSYRVIRTDSSYWYNSGPRVYQAFPYHWVIQPSAEELREFLLREKAIGLRFSTTTTAAEGLMSYHAIYEGGAYTLESLSANARSKVRRGLKACQVEPISLQQLAHDGWQLQVDTVDRQGRAGSITRQTWEQLCHAADDLPGFQAWGAFVGKDVAASILTAIVGDACYMLYPQSHRQYFDRYVNNALAYTISHHMMTQAGVRMIFYGLHSLDAPPSVDEFKFRMGYVAKPVRQRVIFHPWIVPFFNRFTYSAIKRVQAWRPNQPALAKVEGLIRFYLQGKLPLNEQVRPDVSAK